MADDENRKDAGSPLGSLPRWEARPEVFPEYVCPSCRRPSRYARPYTVPLVLFGLVFWVRWTETVFECPACIRRRLLTGLPLRVLLANLAAPVILIWLGVLWARSYSKLPFDDGR